VTAKDNRLFVEAVLYRYRAGIPWRDLPERFGERISLPNSSNIERLPHATINWQGTFCPPFILLLPSSGLIDDTP
jgi:transposase